MQAATVQAHVQSSGAAAFTNDASTFAGHQEQYSNTVASFFDVYGQDTGRNELYYGYLAGLLHGDASNDGAEKKIAVDFGCGTGWLPPRLQKLGFDAVYGIDTSTAMLRIAYERTASELTQSGRVRYHDQVPSDIVGACDLVAAVHVHYHFDTQEKLRDGFFGEIASLLKDGGDAIIIGCPSEYVGKTPPHYQNHIHRKDVPQEVAAISTSLNVLSDDEGYVPLSKLPKFALRDGTQMRVNFKAHDAGVLRQIQLTDTFWSDSALIRTAKEVGLELVGRTQLIDWKDFTPPAYLLMHFRKKSSQLNT